MEIPFDFITFMHLAASVLGVVSAFVIFYFGVKTNPANQPLAFGQLLVSLAIFVGFALVSKLILQWPFLYRLGTPLILAFIPMFYLHIVFYTRNRYWKWYDLLHVIPLLIFLVDYGHVLLLSNSEKLLIIQKEVNDLNLLGEFRQSRFFGPRFHQEFRTILLSVYWVAQVIILTRWMKKKSALTPQNKIWKNWIIFFLSCQFFMWFPFYLSLFGLGIMTTYHIVNSFSVAWLFISSLSLFFFPSLLYGKLYDNSPQKNTGVNKKIGQTQTADRKSEEALLLIEVQMEMKKLFLKSNLNIHQFSEEIQLPAYQISKCLNALKGMTFTDFINQKRIQYCISKFNQGEWLNLTLEAISEECGFSNRNSFTKAFKKFQGQSPSDFRMGLQKTFLH